MFMVFILGIHDIPYNNNDVKEMIIRTTLIIKMKLHVHVL